MINPKFYQQDGYIALVALLVVVTAALTIGIAVSLEGIEEIQMSYGGSQSANAKSLANACIEEGLERLRNNWVSYSPYTLSIAPDSCIIDIVVNGNSATLNATGTVDIYKQKIEMQVDNSLNVINWQED